ncbi:hypothetical protein BGZ60DRAFT_437921 [Tricladium varicosporioides]|nr:hypothetical protein BGZ60DRAFT_437921 [Hymenoscyphus varicosporioides]
MCLDPCVSLISFSCLLRIFHELYGQAEQWEMYGEFISQVSALISEVQSDRYRLSRKLINSGIDNPDAEIKMAEKALERARRLAIWGNDEATRSACIGPASKKRDRLAFAINYEAIMENKKDLIRHMENLKVSFPNSNNPSCVEGMLSLLPSWHLGMQGTFIGLKTVLVIS